MQIRFSANLANEAAAPQPGCLYLAPRDAQQRPRRDLSVVAIEAGEGGFVAGTAPLNTIFVQADPTLDDMLAVLMLDLRQRTERMPSIVHSYAEYAALCREGLRPSDVPLEQSLEGTFLALRKDGPDDLSSPEATATFLKQWQQMAKCLEDAIRRDIDPFSLPLFEGRVEFARQRAFLAHDRDVYRQDVARGERWKVAIPGGPPRAWALILHEPKSALWKYWARSDEAAPGHTGYLLLCVRRGPGHWAFSTDPVQRLSLRPLAEMLQRAESLAAKRNPDDRQWFDGQPMGYTLVAAPRAGTRLTDDEVLGVLQKWTQGERINGQHEQAWTRVGAAALVVLLLMAVGWWGWHQWSRPSALPGVVESFSQPQHATATLRANSDLYVFTIGVSKYADPSYRLEFADKDAHALAEAFHNRPSEVYRKVSALELLNDRATKDNILRGLRQMENQVTENDLVMISFAGHGVSDEHGDYFFLPYDFDGGKELATTAISWDDVRRCLGHMPCLVVLIMDSCQSGTVTRTGLRNIGKLEMEAATTKALRRFAESEKGVVVIAASLGNQSAEERTDWGHGVLTLALLEGITGRRLVTTRPLPLPQERALGTFVTLQDLSYYIAERVKDLTSGSQAVVTNHTGNLSLDDVPIASKAKSNGAVNTPAGNTKPPASRP